MHEPYNIYYIVHKGFCNVPLWLQQAIDEGKVKCNHPETVQDIWDLSWSYEGVPTLTVVETGQEFRMGGSFITYKDVYGEE